MDVQELKDYYSQQETAYKQYLSEQLQHFKDANDRYVSTVIANACHQAEELYLLSNNQSLATFYQTIATLEQKAKDNYPLRILAMMAESAKRTLESSLKFNKNLFDNTIAYQKSLLKR